MRSLAPLLSCLALAAVCAAPAPAAESTLLAADALEAWEFVSETPTEPAAVCTATVDGAILLAGQPTGWLATRASHQNFRIHFEYRWTAKAGNAGLLLHITSGPKDRIWPQCFQVQTKDQRAGDLLPMAGAICSPMPAEGAKAVDRRADASEKPAGEWNVCDVICRGDTIECTVNGVLQNRVERCQPAAGRIGFQFEGVPYEMRHVTIETLP
jgi:hypothetical protein